MKKQILTTVLAIGVTIGAMATDKKKTEAVSTSNEPVIASSVCLTGIIVDEKSKETLAGVEVMIEGTQLKTYTDFEGNFSFDGLKPGTYKVITNYVSYNQTTSRQVDLKTNEMHSLNLELTAQNTSPGVEESSTESMLATK
jgi:hypothetical protein